MKINQKGFIVPVFLVVIALLVVGGGVYVYKNKMDLVAPVDMKLEQSNQVQQQTNAQTPPVNTQTNNSSSQSVASNWKIETNTQYSYQISYPSAQVLTASKIRTEIQVGGAGSYVLAACESAKQMSEVQHLKINNIDFYFNPVQANGSEFIVEYTTNKNSLCYQILFHIGDRNSTLTSPETKKAVDLSAQIMSTFNFTSANTTSGWKTYRADKYGVSFSYPPNFQIVTDKIQIEYIGHPKGFNWYRIELTDPSASEKPFMRFEIDPDGYGPFFPDKTYQLTESTAGKVVVNSVNNSSGENSNDGKVLIIPNVLEASNGHSYYWQFSFTEAGKDYEPTFKQILSTFQFSK